MNYVDRPIQNSYDVLNFKPYLIRITGTDTRACREGHNHSG